MALAFRSYAVCIDVDKRRSTALGILTQSRMVSVHCSATKFPILTSVASVAETAMLARSLVQHYLPDELRHYISSEFRCFVRRSIAPYVAPEMTIVIEEWQGYNCNEVFEAAESYLATKIAKHVKEENYNVTLEDDEEILDTFNGVQFRWILHHRLVESQNSRDQPSEEVRSFKLSFHKRHKDMAIESYLPSIVKKATSMKQEEEKLKLFTQDTSYFSSNQWTSVTLDHPSTFETLAMDSDVKKRVMEDLDQFVQRRNFYKRVGKAWKRSYLLYGPPGTGKSSLIAAMANYLKFDIYDLDLTAVSSNSELRKLLVSTANRSILVVEDIDCSIRSINRTNDDESEKPRNEKVTLSGILNFMDGLWSSCGDERIIIFTTNYKERLDEALLRPGRMDMHIHMSYCTPGAFKVLASNYLQIEEHDLFSKIEDSIGAIEVSPADVAEQLLRDGSVDKVLEGLIEFLEAKKIKNEQDKAGKELVNIINDLDNTKETTTVGKKT